MTEIPLFIPEPGSALIAQVAPGSAIVGTERAAGGWLVYYEGNTIGASNIVTLADRAHHAAGRMRANDPTIAKAMVPATDLRRAGAFHVEEGRIEPDGEDGARALADWLGLEGWFPASVAIEHELVRSK